MGVEQVRRAGDVRDGDGVAEQERLRRELGVEPFGVPLEAVAEPFESAGVVRGLEAEHRANVRERDADAICFPEEPLPRLREPVLRFTSKGSGTFCQMEQDGVRLCERGTVIDDACDARRISGCILMREPYI